MSEKVYTVYRQQIDKYHLECNIEDFASKTLNLMNTAFMDSKVSPTEYMQLCKYRAQLLIAYG